MQNEHQVDGEALAIIQFAMEHHHHWIVYNTVSYLLRKEDIHCFNKRDEAEEFGANNFSEFDDYTAIEADSLEDALQMILSAEQVENTPERKERTRSDMDDLDMGRTRGNRL